MSFLLPYLRCGILAAAYAAGGKNEKGKITSLVIAFDRLSLRRMRNDSRHGRRYTEHRESGEKNSLWRIELQSPLLWITSIQYPIIGKSLSGGRKKI
jgi:hypothetical protein